MKKFLLLLMVLLLAVSLPLVAQSAKYEKMFDMASQCKNIVQWEKAGLIDSEKAIEKLTYYEKQMLDILQGTYSENIVSGEILVGLNKVLGFDYIYSAERDNYATLVNDMINDYKTTGDPEVLKTKLIALLGSKSKYAYITQRAAFANLIQLLVDKL